MKVILQIYRWKKQFLQMRSLMMQHTVVRFSGMIWKKITFIVEGNTVRIINSAVYAMQVLQKEMAGEAERAGLTSDDDVMALVKELRNEDENA